MLSPTTNPFQTAYDRVLTVCQLTRDSVVEIAHEICGDDAEVRGVCLCATNPGVAWVRVRGWQDDLESYEDYWLWITNDIAEWSLGLAN